ncbi:unnamed protein product [Cladocopium goreaui]|uniref:132 kDa protein n=1 Tax=Cladocopium goreaui TaxID=2562237 RepID=A0A9P1DY01_9DINO|nr:unnamed protein product [Cladocopium goreaui]
MESFQLKNLNPAQLFQLLFLTVLELAERFQINLRGRPRVFMREEPDEENPPEAVQPPPVPAHGPVRARRCQSACRFCVQGCDRTQRLRRMLQEEQLNCQSVLCTWLLSMFAWGHFSVQRVQKISALVMKDLKSAETSETIWNDLETLSKLGTEGLYANKMHTELMGKCKGLSNLPTFVISRAQAMDVLCDRDESPWFRVLSGMVHKFYNGCPWQRKEDHSAGFHERSRFQWGSWEIKTMNGLVVPRWDLWMSNRGKARDFFESWLHVQMRGSPGSDLTYQVLVFLDRLFMAGLKLYGEDHRDVFENPEDFFVRMLRHEGYRVEDQKIWLVDESSGWWEEKKPCGLNLKEAFDLLHDVKLKDIMQQWVEPSAWPRGAALAEATWSGRHRPGFGDFQRRLELLQPELRRMQVNFRDADGQQALSTAKAIEVHRAAWPFSIWGPLMASYASLAWLCFFARGDKKERKELKDLMWLDLHEALLAHVRQGCGATLRGIIFSLDQLAVKNFGHQKLVAAELKTLGLDIAVHYLDDGLLAGDLGAVSAALRLVQQRAAHLGLDLNLAKCEAVALHPQAVPTLHGALPDALPRHADGTCKVSQNFEFLGAAVGDAAFMQSHTKERAAKAGDLLDAIGVPEDPQVALRLLRACGGFTRMVHSMRCTPPTAHRLALNMFDGMVRRCFGDFSGIHPSDGQWDQATRGLNFAGLGLRATSLHAAGAYIASVGASLEACVDIDSAFSATAVKAAAGLQEGVAGLNHSTLGARSIGRHEPPCRDVHVVFKWADRAGLRPEKEPTRLLLPQCPDDTSAACRRPADVYIPAMAGGPVALDVAVTAPQRQETIAQAALIAGAAAAAYAAHKAQHLQTAEDCRRQGVTFTPMVVEATGTWDLAAAKVLKHMAQAAAARSSNPGDSYSLLLQELCVVVRSWRARVVLRRRCEAPPSG